MFMEQCLVAMLCTTLYFRGSELVKNDNWQASRCEDTELSKQVYTQIRGCFLKVMALTYIRLLIQDLHLKAFRVKKI